MPWFRVDDSFHMHPKTVGVSNAALGLWVKAGSWCAGALKEGELPTKIVRLLGTTRQANELVDAGLWEKTEDGYRFHDWESRNPSRAAVEARREGWRKRQAKARMSRRDSRVTHADSHEAVTPGVTAGVSESHSLNPLTPLCDKGDKGAPDGPAAGPEGAAATPPQPADDSNATRLAHLRAQRLPEAWA